MAILITAAEKRVLELVSQSQVSREIAASWGQSCRS
jgi:DNA-binding CsgD family transcriptional regulator